MTAIIHCTFLHPAFSVNLDTPRYLTAALYQFVDLPDFTELVQGHPQDTHYYVCGRGSERPGVRTRWAAP